MYTGDGHLGDHLGTTRLSLCPPPGARPSPAPGLFLISSLLIPLLFLLALPSLFPTALLPSRWALTAWFSTGVDPEPTNLEPMAPQAGLRRPLHSACMHISCWPVHGAVRTVCGQVSVCWTSPSSFPPPHDTPALQVVSSCSVTWFRKLKMAMRYQSSDAAVIFDTIDLKDSGLGWFIKKPHEQSRL